MIDTPNTTILAATPGDDISVEFAKEFIKLNGYTSETVKLVKIGDQICVIRK